MSQGGRDAESALRDFIAFVLAAHGHQGRSNDPIAEAIPAPDLLDDLAFFAARAGHVGNRLVLAWIERTEQDVLALAASAAQGANVLERVLAAFQSTVSSLP